MRCLLVKSMTIQSALGIHRIVTRVSPRLGQKRADATDVVIYHLALGITAEAMADEISPRPGSRARARCRGLVEAHQRCRPILGFAISLEAPGEYAFYSEARQQVKHFALFCLHVVAAED